MLPLQFPQAIAISGYREPNSVIARVGLLLPRFLTGFAMGFANINFLPTLFDLFGASLMSEKPHQELVIKEDIRRQGGGIGLWLGIWCWCYIGSLSVGFCIGACIISTLNPSWGFYLVIILLAFFLFVNVVAPETRPALPDQLLRCRRLQHQTPPGPWRSQTPHLQHRPEMVA
jgi:MFS family permease